MSKWNPVQYEKFLGYRTRPAIDLRADCPRSPRALPRPGLRPGQHQGAPNAFPGARIVGADNSEEMLLKARERCPETEFVNADAAGDLHELTENTTWSFRTPASSGCRITAGCCPGDDASATEGGTLAVQIPMQREHPVHRILGELVRSEKWKGKARAEKVQQPDDRGVL